MSGKVYPTRYPGCNDFEEVNNAIFQNRIALAKRVRVNKAAKKTLAAIVECQLIPKGEGPFWGGSYRGRFFSLEFQAAFYLKVWEWWDRPWEIVVAKEWRRLGVKDWYEAKLVEDRLFGEAMNRWPKYNKKKYIWGPPSERGGQQAPSLPECLLPVIEKMRGQK